MFLIADFKFRCSITELQSTGLRALLFIRYNETRCRLNKLANLFLNSKFLLFLSEFDILKVNSKIVKKCSLTA